MICPLSCTMHLLDSAGDTPGVSTGPRILSSFIRYVIHPDSPVRPVLEHANGFHDPFRTREADQRFVPYLRFRSLQVEPVSHTKWRAFANNLFRSRVRATRPGSPREATNRDQRKNMAPQLPSCAVQSELGSPGDQKCASVVKI